MTELDKEKVINVLNNLFNKIDCRKLSLKETVDVSLAIEIVKKLTTPVVSNCATYTITPQIRYKKKSVDLGNELAKEEYRLQQRWQGSDGSEDWQWVDYIE